MRNLLWFIYLSIATFVCNYHYYFLFFGRLVTSNRSGEMSPGRISKWFDMQSQSLQPCFLSFLAEQNDTERNEFKDEMKYKIKEPPPIAIGKFRLENNWICWIEYWASNLANLWQQNSVYPHLPSILSRQLYREGFRSENYSLIDWLIDLIIIVLFIWLAWVAFELDVIFTCQSCCHLLSRLFVRWSFLIAGAVAAAASLRAATV